MDYTKFNTDTAGLDIAGMQNYLKTNHNVTDYSGLNTLADYTGYAKGLYAGSQQSVQAPTATTTTSITTPNPVAAVPIQTVPTQVSNNPEDLTQFGADYMGEINKRKSINPNDPSIAALTTLRDQKLTGLYGNDFQSEISRRKLANPNDPMIADLTRLMNAANNPTFTPPPVETYKSQYSDQERQALEDYNNWAKQPYVSQYAPQIEELVKNILARQFNYDPKNDAQFQLASKELTRNVMESMNARGILNSTITEGQTQQGIADMLPQYRQQAYNQFINEGQMLMSQVDMLMGIDNTQYGRYQDQGAKFAKSLELISNLDNKQYQQWHDAYTDKYNTAKDTYDAAVNNITIKQNEINAAWKKVQELGYVDNKSAITLGVAPGTLSKEAREAKTKREQDLADTKAANKQTFDVIEKNYQNNRKLDEASSQRQLQNSLKLEGVRTANDIMIQKEKAKIDKENQKLVTFNDLQTQFTALKKQLTTDQFEIDPDTNMKVLKSKAMSTGSVGYQATIGSNLTALVENKVITPDQANQLSVQYTGKPYNSVVQVSNYSDTMEGYKNLVESKQMTKQQVYAELKSFTPEDIKDIGEYYYKTLLNKFK